MLLVFVILCLLVGRLGAMITAPALEIWYPTLVKPDWTPPNIVFPVAWSLIFLAIGIAAWLVWKHAERGELGLPLTLFFLQLGLNIAWSFAFFGLQSPLLGVFVLAALIGAVVATTLSFASVLRAAGWLFLPYILWLGYAAALNIAIWRLNS
ncbi:TspO/MBR family protein [Pelagibius sp.]|uniref:TspO/MBR family protein n=1 Tax=Pelagibius sp. TaxID=1931238 RepID=UPI003B50F07E